MALNHLVPSLRNAIDRAEDKGVILLEREAVLALPINPSLREELHRVWGMPYVKGAETAYRGFDCSGFAWWVCDATPAQKQENKDFHRASSQYFIRQGTKRLVSDYFEGKRNQEVYPLVLAIVEKAFDHSVVLYGTTTIGDNRYFIIGQSGQYRGIGHDDQSVSVALVREDVFMKKFGAYQVYIPQLARDLAKKQEPIALK
ncbi:Uncharacterised protein [Candidatus Bilamarchaeum dharawalense]|uniref:NlpC/P60 family protein n=1 Tax=Candidatus Bilamarchaeum dharawalense TaxID=2885759 RepID=A0A5E4LT55_9ARCH|nr:Uncharacterised protein [Candidatus Bilamarchaeum dharawalense]